MIVVAGKVEHSTADHNVGESIWEGHCFDSFQSKVVRWEIWRDRCGEVTRFLESPRIGIHSKHLEPFPQEVCKVTTKAAACIKNPHPNRDSLSEELVEQVDVDPS